VSRALSLTTDAIPSLTWRIAIPASIGMFFNTMYNFVDTYCAGLLNTDALAALSVSFPVFFVMFAFGSGLSQGTTALIANALGAGDHEDARRIFAQSLVLTLLTGTAVSVAGWTVAPWMFRQLGAEGDYLRAVVSYMHVILAGGIFFFLPMTLNALLGARGETWVYRNFLIAGFLANCVLNPVFMWGWFGLPAMGVAGIALATVVIQIGGCVWLSRHVISVDVCHPMPRRCFQPDAPTLRRILAQSVPATLNMLTIAVGIFVITWFVKHFGKQAVAASGIATRVEQLVLMPVIGLNSAVLSIVAQNHGAGLSHRVREAWATNLKYGAGLMLIGGALLWLMREPAMRLFTDDAAVILHGGNYLSIAAFTLAAYPILFVTVFMMQGLKRPTYGLWIGLYRQIAAPILVFNLLAFTLGFGLWGVWWGIGIVTWSAALFALWYGWRTVRPAAMLPSTTLRRDPRRKGRG
jgi:putative MATE family efflux protein